MSKARTNVRSSLSCVSNRKVASIALDAKQPNKMCWIQKWHLFLRVCENSGSVSSLKTIIFGSLLNFYERKLYLLRKIEISIK